MIFTLRLPRTLGALFVGGALVLSGSAYQGVFKNPLVSPDLLGVSSGACVGAAAAILGIIVAAIHFFFSLDKLSYKLDKDLFEEIKKLMSICTKICFKQMKSKSLRMPSRRLNRLTVF